MFYLAYGSNLCESRLKSRAPSARFVGVAKLARHELRFHKLGQDGTAKADAFDIGDGAEMWGALAEVAPDEMDALDEFEPGYERSLLPVEPGYEKSILPAKAAPVSTAWVYRATADSRREGMQPQSWYLDHMIDGGRARGLPLGYLRRLARTPALDGEGPDVKDC